MKAILQHLLEHQTLSKSEAKETLKGIAAGKYNTSQMAAFLTIYMMRSVTIEELEGFRDALLELCLPVNLSAYDPIDLCGTGGDGKNTFNISTLASFVAAGAGIKVAKHGNYGVSSNCGSSNVLEYLGYQFTNNPKKLEKQIDKAGICFLHAPLFHPAMRNVGPIRRELGVKTFFNMLGPMVNPAFPKKQLVGVFSLELARLYAYLYQQSDKKFIILHALDTYDEISLTGPFKMISNYSEQILEPEDLGLKQLSPKQIKGGDTIAQSATIFMKILKGSGTAAQNEVVAANAGMAIHCARPEIAVTDAIEAAKESIHSGSALQSFDKLIAN